MEKLNCCPAVKNKKGVSLLLIVILWILIASFVLSFFMTTYKESRFDIINNDKINALEKRVTGLEHQCEIK